jgi:hypothetical protein
MTTITMRMRQLAGVLALAATATAAEAQAPTRIVSINPFLPLAGSFQGEFETRIRDNMSVAVSGSYLSFGDDNDDNYTNADIKLRLYPSERALQGFGIAAGLGVGRQTAVTEFVCIEASSVECINRRVSATGATFSVEMQYQWLLGTSRNTAVTVGGGAKRYYIDESRNGINLYTNYVPTLRLTVGYAFK